MGAEGLWPLAKDTDESKGSPLRVFRPKGELLCRIRDRKPRRGTAARRRRGQSGRLAIRRRLAAVNRALSAIPGSGAFRCFPCRKSDLRRPSPIIETNRKRFTVTYRNFSHSRSYTRQKMWYNIQRRKEQTDEQRTEQADSGAGTDREGTQRRCGRRKCDVCVAAGVGGV